MKKTYTNEEKIRGAFNASGLSFDELQAFLEGIADQLEANA